jgi:hypothetical protein
MLERPPLPDARTGAPNVHTGYAVQVQIIENKDSVAFKHGLPHFVKSFDVTVIVAFIVVVIVFVAVGVKVRAFFVTGKIVQAVVVVAQFR